MSDLDLTAHDHGLRSELESFLLHESSLLDRRHFHTWLGLISDDFRYAVPIPVTRDNPGVPSHSANAYLVEESRDSIANTWIPRLEPGLVEWAWGENPPQRIRRFVTNVLAEPTERTDEYLVRSNILLSFARQSDPVVLVPAGREDVVRRTAEGDLRLASRRVLLDQTVQTLTHMRIIF